MIYFIFYFLAIVSPYIRHKKTPQSIKNSFQYSSYFSKEEGKERVRPLLDNQEAFEMHLRLIANAKKKIAVSTYRLVLDRAGKTYLAAFKLILLQMAKISCWTYIVLAGFKPFLIIRISMSTSIIRSQFCARIDFWQSIIVSTF